MSKKSIVAKLTAAEGKTAEFEAALASLIEASAEEPELEIYSAHRDPNEENVYYFFELYTSESSLATHGKGEAMKAAMGALGGLLAARPEVHVLDPVVAKGMTF